MRSVWQPLGELRADTLYTATGGGWPGNDGSG